MPRRSGKKIEKRFLISSIAFSLNYEVVCVCVCVWAVCCVGISCLYSLAVQRLLPPADFCHFSFSEFQFWSAPTLIYMCLARAQSFALRISDRSRQFSASRSFISTFFVPVWMTHNIKMLDHLLRSCCCSCCCCFWLMRFILPVPTFKHILRVANVLRYYLMAAKIPFCCCF